MTYEADEKQIERGIELDWPLRDVARELVRWVLFAMEGPNDPWLGMLLPEIRRQTEWEIRTCPYRVSLLEFSEEMFEDGTYSTDPEYWSRNLTRRFGRFADAISWLIESGYSISEVGVRSAIGAP